MATEKKPVSVEEEETSRLEVRALKEENKQLAQQVVALKAALDERIKTDEAKVKAKDESVTRQPRALVKITGVGGRPVTIGAVLFTEELEGLTQGVHYETR